jgi:phenylalanyl-tRNA synthetase beta chain
MANIKFSRKEFEKYIKLTPEIEDKISMFGTNLESLNKEEVEIEIMPNRPDLYSLPGFMRGFLAFIGKKTGLKEYKVNKPAKDFEVKIDKSVKDIRPYTACAIVKGLKFDDEKIKEVIDIQEKIHTTLGRNRKKIAIGIYPLEKIKLPIRFEARKPDDIRFIPLESDKEMNGLQILQQHPTGREYAHLLEGKPLFPVFVDADGKILSMPPIINSSETGKITQSTQDIFIECSGFNLDILKKTLNILVTMFADIQGTVYQMKLLYDKPEVTPNLAPEKMKIEIENVNNLLGLELKEQEVKKLLERMGYGYKNKTVEIPAYRTDIMHEVDIIEDIAIAYGMDNFKPELPKIATIGESDHKEQLKKKISDLLIGLGMLEISSYHLLTKDDVKKSGSKSEIEVERSKTDYTVLRPDLLCSCLKTLAENIAKEYPQKIFELGTVFSIDKEQETGIAEKEQLCLAIAPGNFTEAKQVLEYLERMLAIKFELEAGEHSSTISGRTAILRHKKQILGVIGEIHPSILKKWHMKLPVSILQLDLDSILKSLQ